MKLILQKDVKNLGKAGDQVMVKKGYARNFLIPKGQALPLNKDRLKLWKHQQVIIESKKRKAVVERKTLIQKLSSIKLKFEKESQKDGRLFGSVTSYEISQALELLHDISVDKRDISTAVLKTSGDHKITIALDSENKVDITVSIKGKVTKKQKDLDDSKEDKGEKVSFLQKAKMAILKNKKADDVEQPETEQSAEEKQAGSDTTQAVKEDSVKDEKTSEDTEETEKETDS